MCSLDHLGWRGVRAIRDKAQEIRNSFRMVATDLKLIKSLMRRDSFCGNVPNAESSLIILNSQSAL